MKIRLLKTITAAAVLLLAAAVATLVGSAATAGSSPADNAGRNKFELHLFGSFAFSRITGSTLYSASWSSNYLSAVNEQTVITMYPDLGLAAGASLAYFFSPTIGIQLRTGFLGAGVGNTSVFNFHWTWNSGESGLLEQGFDRLGHITTLPLSINLAARTGTGRVEGAFSGGLTLFRNTFRADTIFGYGTTKTEPVFVDPNWVLTQYVDALPVGLSIPATSWTALGADLGAALNLMVNDRLAIRLEARYFYCPTKTLTWNFVYGSYDGIFFTDIKGQPFGTDEASDLARSGKTFTLPVNPSYVEGSIGVVFYLGGAIRK
jgi:hypothetical protein